MPFICFERLLSAAQASSSAVSTYVAEGDEHFVCSDFLQPSTDRPYFDALMSFWRKWWGDKEEQRPTALSTFFSSSLSLFLSRENA